MGIIIWLVCGAIVGWLASLIMRREGQGLLVDIVVGIVGSFIGRLIFARGTVADGVLSVNSFIVSIIGAVILLAIVNLVRRGSMR